MVRSVHLKPLDNENMWTEPKRNGEIKKKIINEFQMNSFNAMCFITV